MLLLLVGFVPETKAVIYADQSRLMKSRMKSAGSELEQYFNQQGYYPEVEPGNFPEMAGLRADLFHDDHKVADRRWVWSSDPLYFRTAPGFFLVAIVVFWIAAVVYRIISRSKASRRCLVYGTIGLGVLFLYSIGSPFAGSARYTRENPHWPDRKELNYYSDGKTWWVLQSVGHDLVRNCEDLSVFAPGTSFSLEQETRRVECAYDPTNGTFSPGDILVFGTRGDDEEETTASGSLADR